MTASSSCHLGFMTEMLRPPELLIIFHAPISRPSSIPSQPRRVMSMCDIGSREPHPQPLIAHPHPGWQMTRLRKPKTTLIARAVGVNLIVQPPQAHPKSPQSLQKPRLITPGSNRDRPWPRGSWNVEPKPEARYCSLPCNFQAFVRSSPEEKAWARMRWVADRFVLKLWEHEANLLSFFRGGNSGSSQRFPP